MPYTRQTTRQDRTANLPHGLAAESLPNTCKTSCNPTCISAMCSGCVGRFSSVSTSFHSHSRAIKVCFKPSHTGTRTTNAAKSHPFTTHGNAWQKGDCTNISIFQVTTNKSQGALQSSSGRLPFLTRAKPPTQTISHWRSTLGHWGRTFHTCSHFGSTGHNVIVSCNRVGKPSVKAS